MRETDYEVGWRQGYSAAIHTMVDLLKFGGKNLEADQIMKAFVESGELMKTYGAAKD